MKEVFLLRNKFLRAVFVILLIAFAVILYAVLMIYALPSALKPYLEKKASEAIGGEAHIGAVDVYPFKLAIAVRDFSARNNMAKLAWDSLHIDAQLRSIFTQNIYLDEFRIHNPQFKFTSKDSATHLVKEAFSARTGRPMRIKRFTIQSGALEIFDKQISPISFSLENFSTEYSSGEGNNYNLQFIGLNGGFFRWNGNLQWNPFLSEGELEVRDLDVTQLRDFYQEHLPFDLQRGKLNLRTRYTMFEKPEFGISLENAKALLDSVNAQGVLRKTTKFPSSKFFEDKLSGWKFKIDSMQVRQGQFKFIDSTASVANEHNLKSIQLLLTNITSDKADSIDVAGTAVLNSGKLALQGALNLFPLHASANLSISDFPLSSLQNYLSRGTWLNLQQGFANARLNARLRPLTDSLQKDTLIFAGDAEIDSLRLLSKNNQEFIRAQQASVKEFSLSFAPETSWQIASVNLQSPIMHLTWFAKSPANYSQIKKPKAKDEENKFIPFNIKQINFKRGTFHLTDKDPATPFSYSITSMQGNLRNFSNQKRDTHLSIEGKMGGYAPVSLKGPINLSGKRPKLNFAIKAANQDLVPFSPYFGKHAGYRVAKGQMAFEADYALANNKMQGSNHIAIQHLTFGEAVESPEATNLPVRLAAALLSDKNGVIDLDVAITGDLDDPEFSVGSLIWKVIKNLLGKAAAAPLKSLMALIGDSADPEAIAFAPGSAQLGGTQLELLKNLSQALMQRPQLQLDVHGNADSTLDGNALREARLPANSSDLKNLANKRAQNIKIELVNLDASLGERIFVVGEGSLSSHSVNLKIRER